MAFAPADELRSSSDFPATFFIGGIPVSSRTIGFSFGPTAAAVTENLYSNHAHSMRLHDRLANSLHIT
jgi:hypothetical protein